MIGVDMNVLDYEVGDVNMNGSSLKGYVTTTYDRLVEVFGEPTYSDADPYEKVNAEWEVSASVYDTEDDDTVDVKFTVYNWKTGSVPTEEYQWHIGGYDNYASLIAQRIIGGEK
jgi:hypothetical protein